MAPLQGQMTDSHHEESIAYADDTCSRDRVCVSLQSRLLLSNDAWTISVPSGRGIEAHHAIAEGGDVDLSSIDPQGHGFIVQAKVKAESFHVIYDNINMVCRKYDQWLENWDSFESGTTTTAVISKETAEERDTNPARLLRVEGLFPTPVNNVYLRQTMRSNPVNVL
ncbi:hypothetical protein BX616_003467 [Lobosporangium transversale]|nr:hypothetical protein BX616_003467 [Lobosporangium transversale]